jgi:hypothetical protein
MIKGGVWKNTEVGVVALSLQQRSMQATLLLLEHHSIMLLTPSLRVQRMCTG